VGSPWRWVDKGREMGVARWHLMAGRDLWWSVVDVGDSTEGENAAAAVTI
jgi:hypothetical protein